MKFIVNSEYLSKMLKKVKPDDRILFIESDEANFITLGTMNGKKILLNVDHDEINKRINQSDRRWDWVALFCKEIGEQPLVMDISERNIRISVDY